MSRRRPLCARVRARVCPTYSETCRTFQTDQGWKLTQSRSARMQPVVILTSVQAPCDPSWMICATLCWEMTEFFGGEFNRLWLTEPTVDSSCHVSVKSGWMFSYSYLKGGVEWLLASPGYKQQKVRCCGRGAVLVFSPLSAVWMVPSAGWGMNWRSCSKSFPQREYEELVLIILKLLDWWFNWIYNAITEWQTACRKITLHPLLKTTQSSGEGHNHWNSTYAPHLNIKCK